ncbi:MAG: hypothetical protein R6V03_05355 [Kiritimatiellia bacterium]
MSDLGLTAVIAGGILTALYVFFVLAGGVTTRRVIAKFPRNRPAALVLSAADVVWAAVIVLNAELGRFEHYKPWLYVLAPVLYFCVIQLMDELLAPRALGGLLLLAACPMLAAARWHESAWKYLVAVVAYIIVVKGMVLILSPYKFRQAMDLLIRNRSVFMLFSLLGLALGILLIFLGVKVY